MAYDEGLADRIRDQLSHHDGLVEKKMFGGISFLLRGNMCCGVIKEDMCARVGPERFEEYLALPHARLMDFTKRPMKGWLYVSPEGLEDEAELAAWVKRCEAFCLSLPAK